MYNFKSVFVQPFDEPLAVTFNKGLNKNYRFGFTINQEDADFDRSVVVLEDNIYFKSDLTQEISTKHNGNTISVSNCGDKIFNEFLFVMPDTDNQDVDVYYTIGEKQVFSSTSSYRLYPNITLSEVDTKHTAYVTFINSDTKPNQDDKVLNYKDKYYVQKEYIVTPVTLEINRTFTNSYMFDLDDYIIRLDDSPSELTLLVTDYEIEIDPKKEKISSIIALEEQIPVNVYYDRINTNNVRFVTSNYGKIFSLTQFTEDDYKEPLIVVFSDEKFNNTETVSIRTGFDHYNQTFDVTANF